MLVKPEAAFTTAGTERRLVHCILVTNAGAAGWFQIAHFEQYINCSTYNKSTLRTWVVFLAKVFGLLFIWFDLLFCSMRHRLVCCLIEMSTFETCPINYSTYQHLKHLNISTSQKYFVKKYEKYCIQPHIYRISTDYG